jgi:hypothetical protein
MVLCRLAIIILHGGLLIAGFFAHFTNSPSVIA